LSLRRAISRLEDADNGLSDRFRRLLDGLWHDIRTLDERVAGLDADIAAIAQSDPNAVRLQQLRGIGPIIATALLAAVGDARFRWQGTLAGHQ
jgi:transposase